MIPKIIHQTAPADETKWPFLWKICQKTWQEKFPDWQYMFWNDDDLEKFIREEYPWFYETYMSYDKTIKRVDAARYFILHKYGGIYADMDYECLKNFEHLIPPDKVSIGVSPLFNRPDMDRKLYDNALMISPAGHPAWEKAFEILEAHRYEPNPLFCTGPKITIELGASTEINTLDNDLFAPGDCVMTKGVYPPVNNPETCARHLLTMSWVEKV